MPEISRFYGVVIKMYRDDHPPAHFHALYGEFEALIDIASLEVLRGGLPQRALALVLEWALLHRAELRENWELCDARQPLKKIRPLR